MKKIIIIAATIILAATARCIGQVTVSPEIGISYLPVTIYGANSIAQSNRIDYLFGISGNLMLSEKWNINTRVSYIRRETLKWTDHSFKQDYINELKYNDLNIDFSVNYKITKTFHIGAGPIIIRKINSSLHTLGNIYGQSHTYSVNGFQYGVHSALSADFRFFILKLEYARKIFKANNVLFYNTLFYNTTEKNRYNLTLAFPIKKQGKR
ncbi:MAG TPA: hypothetical protein PLZ12_01160 [Saprospiraceae bacterium]|nr:hypothetical protein [Saprospiraceae bacterium]